MRREAKRDWDQSAQLRAAIRDGRMMREGKIRRRAALAEAERKAEPRERQ